MRVGGASTTLTSQTLQPPRVDAFVQHRDTRLYTLALVDLGACIDRIDAHRTDYPDEARDAFQQYCHWLVTDLPLSPTSMSVEAATASAQVAIPYQPPHPQRGTQPHRLVIALLRQSGSLSAAAPMQRTRFDVRSLIRAHSLDPVGLHFFRSEWSPAVSGIYAELGLAEPHYRHPQDVAIDPYRVHGGQTRSPFFQA